MKNIYSESTAMRFLSKSGFTVKEKTIIGTGTGTNRTGGAIDYLIGCGYCYQSNLMRHNRR